MPDVYYGYSDLPTDLKATLKIDQWINKDVTRPDSVEFYFQYPVPSAELTKTGAENLVSILYAKFSKKADTSGNFQSFACVNYNGQPEQAEVINFSGSTGYGNADTAVSFNEMKAAKQDLAGDGLRAATYWPEYYTPTVDATNAAVTWVPCLAVLDRKKFTDYTAFWDTYSVAIDVRVTFDASESGELYNVPVMSEPLFDLVLAAPSYEFGDAYEKTDEPYNADLVIDEVSPF